MNKVLFQEEQRFNQWWLYIIIFITAIVIIATAVGATLESSGTVSAIVLILSSLFGLFFVESIFLMKLKTVITEEKISMHYYPFLKKEWKWSELKVAQVMDYGFVGGWGIRIWTGMGTVYNVRGSKGLHIKTDQKEYVIGTQKEEELRSSIAHLLK